MADIAFDPNQQESSTTTTDILSNQAPNDAENNQQSSMSTSGQNYVSNGNPYGSYGTPQSNSTQNNQPTQNTVKTTNKAPSSGQHTNVQSYIDKNQAGSKQLGQSVSNKLQTSAELARQDLQGTQKSFNQEMDSGSLQNWQGANKEAKGAYQRAATQKAPINKPQASLGVSDDRLSDILNAKYAGPSDLHEIEGYSDTFNKFNKAQSLQDLAQDRGFKGTLLKETFQNPTNNYSLGNQLLDDLLLGQGKAADTLKQTADNLGQVPSGRINDEFEARASDSRNLALGRAKNIDDVRVQARADLDSIASGRSDQIEARMGNLIKDWDKYPDHYRKILQEEMIKHEDMSKKKASFDKYRSELDNLLASSDYKKQLNEMNTTKHKYDIKANFDKLTDRENQLLTEMNGLQYGITEAKRSEYIEELNKIKKFKNDLKSEYRNIAVHAYDPSTLTSSEFFNNQNPFESKLKEARTNYQPYEDKRLSLTKKVYNYQPYSEFDPNSMNLGLSALESEMLGIKGGEGLYNLLSQKGGIDNLIKTAKADKNKLISKNEQSQLSRLQSIAELANDYGSKNSGIDFNNKYTNAKLAGTQSALSALDMNNLQNKLQSSEKEFRDFADSRTETGVGVGKGSSGGMFGKKTKKVTAYETANLGDVLDRANAKRDIYSNKGVDRKTVDKILGLSKAMAENDGLYASGTDSGIPQVSRAGQEYLGQNSVLGKAAGMSGVLTGDYGSTIEGVGNLTGDAANIYKNIVGNTPVLAQHAGALGEIGKGIANVGSSVSSGMFGSSGSAAKKAASNAQAAAIADLRNKITDTLNKQGYGNQFVRQNNTQRDAELLQLLGLLDTTNR